MTPDDAIRFLRSLFQTAIEAALPDKVVPPHLPRPPSGRTIVLGAGKASAAMARVVEQHWQGDLDGLVVTRYGHAVPCERIEVAEAAHPVPDASGELAARRILDRAHAAGPDDLVLCLISGGGSSLLALPAPGLALADKGAVNSALLACGANISEMNTVRKHLSAIKGGRLAQASWPARVHSLVISDVPGDDPSVIASGPTVGDRSTLADARAVVDRYALDLPDRVSEALSREANETPKPDLDAFKQARLSVVASPRASLEAAAALARKKGVTPLILGDAIEGEAREVGTVMAGVALSIARHGEPVQAPAVVLSGGETTVTLRSSGGKGGRNAEFLAGLALGLNQHQDIYALAGDTDGIDGSEDNAGALITPDTLHRGRRSDLDLRQRLSDNDVHGYFATLGDLVTTGPTLTNVNDFRAILVTAS